VVERVLHPRSPGENRPELAQGVVGGEGEDLARGVAVERDEEEAAILGVADREEEALVGSS
jgi:hypothetical protein